MNPASAISTLPPNSTLHCATCGRPKLDARGDHAENCYGDGNRERDHVHDAIKFEVAAMLSSAGFKISVEPAGAYLDSGKRPDVRVDGYYGSGAHLDLDVGTISTTGDIIYLEAANLPGSAADQVESNKHAAWDAVATDEGNKVKIIAYELGGRFGGEALKFFDDVARSSTSTSVAANAFKSYWLRRIATVAQKAFGRLLLARLPPVSYAPSRGMRVRPDPLAHVLLFPSAATIGGGVLALA